MSNVTETPMTHEEKAQLMILQLRQMAQTVIGYGLIPVGKRRQVSASAAVSDDFLATIGTALDGWPNFATAAELTGAEVRDGMSFIHAFGPLADEMFVIARTMRDTVTAKRAELSAKARRAYKIAKGFNDPADQSPPIIHLDAMKRALTKPRRKKTEEKIPAALTTRAAAEVQTPGWSPADMKKVA